MPDVPAARQDHAASIRRWMFAGALAVAAASLALACTAHVAPSAAPDGETATTTTSPVDSERVTAAPPPTQEDVDPEATERVSDDGEADNDVSDSGPDDDGQENSRGRLVIHHVGDVSLEIRDIPVLARGDLAGPWDGVRETFDDADLVLVNLECAATDGGSAQEKQFVFRCALDALPAMRDAGVDVANLANNHTGDYGIQGMVDSVDNVRAAGMAAVGVGRNEEEAYTPHVVEVAGWRVAVLGFGGVVPVPEWTARGDRPGQATGYDAARMAHAVEVAKADADLVIVTVHWGAEGSSEPRPEDVLKARAVIAAGADVVFGHHAHRLQPLEIVDGAPVFWNLGNFVWPRRSLEAATTAVAEYVVEPDGTVATCLLPFEIDHQGVPRPTGEPRRCAEPTYLP